MMKYVGRTLILIIMILLVVSCNNKADESITTNGTIHNGEIYAAKHQSFIILVNGIKGTFYFDEEDNIFHSKIINLSRADVSNFSFDLITDTWEMQSVMNNQILIRHEQTGPAWNIHEDFEIWRVVFNTGDAEIINKGELKITITDRN